MLQWPEPLQRGPLPSWPSYWLFRAVSCFRGVLAWFLIPQTNHSLPRWEHHLMLYDARTVGLIVPACHIQVGRAIYPDNQTAG